MRKRVLKRIFASRLTKKRPIILDHWGKGAPTKKETDQLLKSLLELMREDQLEWEQKQKKLEQEQQE